MREHITHPIIDSDAHYSEFLPLFREQFLEGVREVGGAALGDEVSAAPDFWRYLLERTTPMGQAFGATRWTAMSADERRQSNTVVPGWSPPHSNMLDRATSFAPRLLHERMDEIGIDFSILYPGLGLVLPHLDPPELRQVACRVYNRIVADAYRPYADRMTPAAVLPMSTPQEAVDELQYAVTELGFKVGMIGHVARPIPSIHANHPELFSVAFRVDSFGVDSDYDYDPFWAACTSLKVPLVAHNPSYGIGFRRSPTNYIYNQTGNFAEAGDILCRSLFLGGVTRRFPALKFQFLECGVGWACVLYAEMVGRWNKRNIATVNEHIRQARAGEPEFRRLLKEHGSERMAALVDTLPASPVAAEDWSIDDFAAAEIETEQDVHDLFVPRFFFGCEADDPVTAWAFNTKANPLGARLRATLGSDMGHWDVPDMRGIVPEAYELVEKGLLDEAEFRQFTFEHPREFFAGVNPGFFDGTVIESR
ncbi:MAG TPA: amidohydrolase family protein [Candidatus Dormibacteraeota bacterium]|nr:amidohydrolase family protein [Candidatus Dormibacteraeota bacterium]